MVSKSLDEWRRDIAEKRSKRKSKRYYIPMKHFNSKPPQKRVAKLKCSIYFLHLFFRFALNFPNVKNSNCFHHGSTDVCKHTGKGKTFTPMNSSSAKIHESVARLLRQPIHGCGCGTQTHLFSVATKVIIWCQVSFLSYPERNATATRKKPLWWDCFYI